MSHPAQTTLAPSPLRASNRWGALGGFNQRMVAKPDGIFGFVAGLPGSGKSALFQSCASAFIMNLDPSSTTVPSEPGRPAPEPKALMWPGISPEGGALNDEGAPFVLRWEDVLAKVDILQTLAKTNAPRPRIIAFDSLSRVIQLLKDWIVRNAAKFKLASDGAAQWKDIDGRAGWDFLYDHFIDVCVRLRAHGYGVYVVGHIVNAVVQLGEQQAVIRPELTITDNFWKRLYPFFEAVLIAEKRTETLLVQDPAWEPNPNFPHAKPRMVPLQKPRVYLTVGGHELAGITKIRVPLHTVLLEPAENAWDAFEKAYMEAAERGSLEARPAVEKK